MVSGVGHWKVNGQPLQTEGQRLGPFVDKAVETTKWQRPQTTDHAPPGHREAGEGRVKMVCQ